eukprot:scaffold13.g298.t1
MGSQPCLYPDTSSDLLVSANASIAANVLDDGSTLPAQVLASATGFRMLAAIDAALPPSILGDSFIISIFPSDPGSDRTRLTVARTLHIESGLTNNYVETAALDALNDLRAVQGSALSNSWDVYLADATSATYRTTVPAETPIGVANTSRVSLETCLPRFFLAAVPITIGDLLSGLRYSAPDPSDAPACAITTLVPTRVSAAAWLVTNSSASAAVVGAPATSAPAGANASAEALLFRALASDAFNGSDEAYASFTFTSASGRVLPVPALMQTFNGTAVVADTVYSFLIPPSTNVSSVDDLGANASYVVAGDSGSGGASVALTSAWEGFSVVNSSGCLPLALNQAAALSLDQLSRTSAPANDSASASTGDSGGGSSTKTSAVAAGVAVSGAVLLAGAAGLLAWRWRKRWHPTDAEADAEVLQSLADSASRSNCLVPFSELRLRKRLGEGAFGVVWLALWHETPVAVKLLQAQAAGEAPTQLSPAALAALRKASRAWGWESDLMASLRHPNVVLYLGLSAEPGTAALVMEYCSRGSLLDRILQAQQDQSKLPWALRLNLAFGAAKGMLYLHTRVVREQAATSVASSMLGGPGNPRWLAPEVLRGAPATPQSDVFSFGVVLWELLALQLPWAAHDTWGIVGAVQEGQRAPVPPAAACPGFRCHAAYAALLAQCWAQDPAQRPGFGEVCARLRELVSLEAMSERQLKTAALSSQAGPQDGGAAQQHANGSWP